MFHKEIRDGETKRTRVIISWFCGDKSNYKNPEEMNDFIKNLMDPFNNSTSGQDNDFDTHYDEYYDLYNIPKEFEQENIYKNSLNFKKILSPSSYFYK
jgi:hypothetical protein